MDRRETSAGETVNMVDRKSLRCLRQLCCSHPQCEQYTVVNDESEERMSGLPPSFKNVDEGHLLLLEVIAFFFRWVWFSFTAGKQSNATSSHLPTISRLTCSRSPFPIYHHVRSDRARPAHAPGQGP